MAINSPAVRAGAENASAVSLDSPTSVSNSQSAFAVNSVSILCRHSFRTRYLATFLPPVTRGFGQAVGLLARALDRIQVRRATVFKKRSSP